MKAKLTTIHGAYGVSLLFSDGKNTLSTNIFYDEVEANTLKQIPDFIIQKAKNLKMSVEYHKLKKA